MQTKINADMAVGIPGTHGNGQPYFADPYIAGADVLMGGAAYIETDGTAKNLASGKTGVGIFVNPNEHIRMVLPSDERSLVVAKGSTVAVAKKGSWYVALPDNATEAAKWVKGASLQYGSYTNSKSETVYGLVFNASGAVAEILMVGGGVALIRFK